MQGIFLGDVSLLSTLLFSLLVVSNAKIAALLAYCPVGVNDPFFLCPLIAGVTFYAY